MTESEFNRLAAEGYNRIPVTLETFADLDTPLSIYLKLAASPYSYLLESVQGGERFGRYSFIGIASTTRIAVYDSSILLLTGNRVAERRSHSASGCNLPPCAPSSRSWPIRIRRRSPTRSARPTCC